MVAGVQRWDVVLSWCGRKMRIRDKSGANGCFTRDLKTDFPESVNFTPRSPGDSPEQAACMLERVLAKGTIPPTKSSMDLNTLQAVCTATEVSTRNAPEPIHQASADTMRAIGTIAATVNRRVQE